ncbi:PAS domain-containing protein [Ferrimonas sediminicola]|uniref:PAS domain-containing protein n=1 Tax=Ferrimonas sediminicola TaxID=2569538 RepID=A0A4U1BCF1_9GAMM|nr:PAS domain-containing protein [Ferrimonas sediminicola]TKB48646.1 PAS domain-containing protein [Ferrimonas sediminicola]
MGRRVDTLWGQIAVIVCLTAVVLGWAFGVNLESQREQLGNHRFSEVQLFSDRVSDRLLSLQARGQAIAQLGVLRFLLDDPELDKPLLQNYLQGLSNKFEAIEAIELYDDQNRLVVGTELNQLRGYAGQADNQPAMGEEMGRYSPLMLDSKHHRIEHWQRLPIPRNPHGVAYAAIYSDLIPVLSAFYRTDPMGEIPLVMLDLQGTPLKLSHTGGSVRLSPEERASYQALWPEIHGQQFGQLTLGERHYLYLKVAAGHFEPFYLVSSFDDHDLELLARDHRRLLGASGLVLVLFLCWLTIQKHGLLRQQGHFKLAMDITEQLYQHAGSTLLFTTSGKLLSGNPSALKLLGLKGGRHGALWFAKLFDSPQARKGWEIALEQGRWSGQLPAREMQHSLDVELCHTQGEGHYPLVVANLHALTDEEEAYRTLSRTPVGLALLDSNYRLVLSNRALQSMLGLDADACKKLSLTDLVSLPEGITPKGITATLGRDEAWEERVWLATANQGILPLLAKIVASDERGQLVLTLMSPVEPSVAVAGLRELRLFYRRAEAPAALIRITPHHEITPPHETRQINQCLIRQQLATLVPKHSCIAQAGDHILLLVSNSRPQQVEAIAAEMAARFRGTPLTLKFSACWLDGEMELNDALALMRQGEGAVHGDLVWAADGPDYHTVRTYTGES